MVMIELCSAYMCVERDYRDGGGWQKQKEDAFSKCQYFFNPPCFCVFVHPYGGGRVLICSCQHLGSCCKIYMTKFLIIKC